MDINAINSVLSQAGQVDVPQETASNPLGLPVVTNFLDADTVEGSDGGPSYRLKGFNAPEVSKIINDELKLGTAGGQVASEAVEKVLRDKGFVYIQDTGEPAAHGRRTGRLVNERGEDAISYLLGSGVFKPTVSASKEMFERLAVSDWLGAEKIQSENQQAFDELSLKVNEARAAEGYDPTVFQEIAFDEKEYARNPDRYMKDVVKLRSGDRTIDNKALSPFSSTFGSTLIGVQEASYGIASILGNITGLEGLEEFGEAGVYRKGDEISERATTILDYEDVNGFGDALEFVGNLTAMAVPYLGITTVSVGLLGPAGFSVPATLYTGQIWNEQADEGKNAGYAIAGGVLQGALDAVGAGKLIGMFTKPGVTPKKMFEIAKEELVKDGMEADDAEFILSTLTKKELARVSTDAAEAMKKQIRSRERVGELLTGAAKGVPVEAVTEATQEVIGYTAAHLEDNSFNFEELLDRATSAAIAGGVLGGTFGGAAGVWDQAGWERAIWSGQKADGSGLSNDGKYAAEEADLSDDGTVPTNVQNAEQARQEYNSNPEETTDFNDRAEAGSSSVDGDNSVGGRFWRAAAATPSLWRGATRWIFNDNIKARSRSARKLAGMFGGTLQRIFAGNDFESYKHAMVARYENMFDNPKEIYAKLSGGKRVTRKVRKEWSEKIYKVLRAAESKREDGKVVFDPDKIPQDLENREVYVKLGKDLQNVSDKMRNHQLKFNPDLGYVGNYFAKFKSLDKAAVDANQTEFKNLLKKHYKMSDAEAQEVVNKILDNPHKSDIDGLVGDEAFSVTTGTPIPGSHRKRSLAMSEQVDEGGNFVFDKFMEKDIFMNVNYAAKNAARFVAYQQFVGKNGSVIAKLLDQAVDEGLTQAEVNKIASQLKDYLDAESGNYKRAESDFGKAVQKVQKNFLTYSVIVGLPLATLSSMVELMITLKGLTNEQIFAKGGLKTLGSELGTMFYNAGGEIFSVLTRRDVATKESIGMKRIRELGFYETEVGAASKTGVTETNVLKQGLLQEFFKWNGLQGWTQMTRAIRAAIAYDFILNHAETIQEHRLYTDGKGMTNEVELAQESLRNLGIDVQSFLDLLAKKELGDITEVELNELRNQLNTATFAFINEAIMMPTAANRPMIYQDPRFALFNQFQGFISVFTSTFIPKLWGEYVKRGSPSMSYQAFSMMALMIMMGYASQELKDRIKYGEDNPYLDDMEKARRAISSSGLLGSGERVINTLFPMYESRTQGVLDYAFTEVTGQSPGLTTAANIASGAASFIEGEPERAANKLLKATPLSAFTAARKGIAEEIGNEWSYTEN